MCLDLAVEYWIERPMAHTFQLITYSEVHMQNIKDYLSYDPLTGLFTWIRSPKYGGIKIGSVAGYKAPDKRIHIRYSNKLYRAHRLAWYFTHGYFPNTQIDHINEDPSDNSITNLRLATAQQNPHNASIAQRNNISGLRGVSWDKYALRWKASITNNRRQIHLGRFDTPEDAHEAYLAAKRELHTFWVENK